MTPEEAAEAHIAETLAMARGVPWASPGVAFAGPEQYEASVRVQAEAFLRPVDDYVGLALPAAQALASGRGDRLCVHPVPGHRADLTSQRVHVLVHDGEVIAAKLDRPQWLDRVAEQPRW